MQRIVNGIDDRRECGDRIHGTLITRSRICVRGIDREHLCGPAHLRQDVGRGIERGQQVIGICACQHRARQRVELRSQTIGACDDLGDVDPGIFTHPRQCCFDVAVDLHHVLARREARLVEQLLERHRDGFQRRKAERCGVLDVGFDVERDDARRICDVGDQGGRNPAAEPCSPPGEPWRGHAFSKQDGGERRKCDVIPRCCHRIAHR